MKDDRFLLLIFMIFNFLLSVTCVTPSRNSLRSFGVPSAAISLKASLSVLKTYDNSVIASTNFTFYDCHQMRSCSECAKSLFSCDWCTISAKCVPNAEDVCQGEALVNGISVRKFNFFF